MAGECQGPISAGMWTNPWPWTRRPLLKLHFGIMTFCEYDADHMEMFKH